MATSESQSRPSRGGDRERGGPRAFRRVRPKACQFCVDKIEAINYKDVDKLRMLVTERGKIKPRGQTGTCAAHQRKVALAIKRARNMAMLPFVSG